MKLCTTKFEIELLYQMKCNSVTKAIQLPASRFIALVDVMQDRV